MNIFNKIALFASVLMLSFSALAGEYTLVDRVDVINSKKVVMRDGTVLKMPSYRPETKVKVMFGKKRETLNMLFAVGYIDRAAITADSNNIVKKINILEMK